MYPFRYVRLDVTLSKESIKEDEEEARFVTDVDDKWVKAFEEGDHPFASDTPDLESIADDAALLAFQTKTTKTPKEPKNAAKELAEKPFSERLFESQL
jgi:hypothetical protein